MRCEPGRRQHRFRHARRHATGARRLRGINDVNGDGLVDVVDIQIIMKLRARHGLHGDPGGELREWRGSARRRQRRHLQSRAEFRFAGIFGDIQMDSRHVR